MIAGTVEEAEILASVAGLVVRYGRKTDGRLLPGEVELERDGGREMLQAEPLADTVFKDWIV
jgi:hypothetical protein